MLSEVGTKSSVKPGTLYLVSTPIGNLRDISLRALDVLAQVDMIAAEDTRTSRVLLNHYGIQTPMQSHHNFNESSVTPLLIRKLEGQLSVAVISDAGTPGISDPAFYLVREAINHQIPIEVIPGATAFVPALLLSGLPTERFVFEGFLPAKKGRSTRIQALQDETRTIILYESPHRLMRTIQDLYTALGNRHVAVLRELTKKYEQVYRGELEEFAAHSSLITVKGEFVVVIAGSSRKEKNKVKIKYVGKSSDRKQE
jgi:16S rRNA (cytidine1402-2'-O)-methyltransferase